MTKKDDAWFQETMGKMADFIQASLQHVMSYAGSEYITTRKRRQDFLEKRYQTNQHQRVVLGMVQEAAQKAGVELTGYTVGDDVELERITEPIPLVSFERFMDELPNDTD